ncbi:hypothetical protein Q8A67_022165 [Cirrhinus molitorella]|uniref:Uncharacterized protein n=1 Tax=Cirrhinus molitorella TaxID=172907 RepID=A0AA88TD83_9TELE|nr:hypothetical protein Q8A67_022165 [Cirrhinus molitorella]
MNLMNCFPLPCIPLRCILEEGCMHSGVKKRRSKQYAVLSDGNGFSHHLCFKWFAPLFSQPTLNESSCSSLIGRSGSIPRDCRAESCRGLTSFTETSVCLSAFPFTGSPNHFRPHGSPASSPPLLSISSASL